MSIKAQSTVGVGVSNHTGCTPNFYTPDPGKLPIQPILDTIAEPAAGSVQYVHSWMGAAVKNRRAADYAKVDPREELRAYLSAPLETTDDVVPWWGVRIILSDHFIPQLTC